MLSARALLSASENTVNMQKTMLVLFLAAMLGSMSARADTMRCGQALVNEDSSVADVLKKCGEPQEKTSTTEDVLAVSAAGHPYKTGATTTRERWIYRRSPGALPMSVTIVDGDIKRIERVE
jgi:hypothetical protein